MGSLAASGGYYVSCGGSYLMAHDTTLTGSIGVIIETLNYESLMGKIGVNAVVFKSGQFKDMLSGARQMTDAEKAYVQDMVMQTYGKFVGIRRPRAQDPGGSAPLGHCRWPGDLRPRRAGRQADRRPGPDRGCLRQGARIGRRAGCPGGPVRV